MLQRLEANASYGSTGTHHRSFLKLPLNLVFQGDCDEVVSLLSC